MIDPLHMLAEIRARTANHAVVASLLAGSLVAACSEDGASAQQCEPAETNQSAQPLSVKCSNLEFDVELDPDSEEFGQLPCVMTSFLGYRSNCPCEGDQFRPASAALTQAMVKAFELDTCASPAPCICEFMQSTGERLETCHREPAQSTSPGWCWVQLDAGLGERDVCDRELRIVGIPRVDGEQAHAFMLACQRTPK